MALSKAEKVSVLIVCAILGAPVVSCFLYEKVQSLMMDAVIFIGGITLAAVALTLVFFMIFRVLEAFDDVFHILYRAAVSRWKNWRNNTCTSQKQITPK